MTKKQEMTLATIQEMDPMVVYTEGGVEPLLTAVAAEVRSHVPDVTTAKGRDEIKSLGNKVARVKVRLDNAGKDLTEEWRQKVNKVNETRSHIRSTLDALKAEARKPFEDWEEDQKRREAEMQAKLESAFYIPRSNTEPGYTTAAGIKDILGRVTQTEVDEGTWGDLVDTAIRMKEACITALETMYSVQVKYEDDQAELEALRKEREALQAEKDALEKEKRERQEAEEEAERKRFEEETNRIVEERRKEREAQIAKEAEERAARQERERLEREKAAAEEEQRKREENARIRKRVHKAVAKALCGSYCGVMKEDEAMFLVEAIADGKIPNVTITY